MSEAQRITLRLGGKWFGRYGVALCPAHDDKREPSLSLGDGEGGRLLARCFAGCAFIDVAAALRRRGLLDERGRDQRPNRDNLALRRAKVEAERAPAIAKARRVWAQATPAAGSLAERYLRARGLLAPLSPSLRFAPDLRHGSGARLPAMIAAVTLDGDAEPVAIHRTYLSEPGRKADVAPNKMMLGPVTGGAARLSDGAGPLVVAEGIETAMALVAPLSAHGGRIWAALSANGMANLRLPQEPAALVLAPDGDPVGLDAAQRLARRAHAAGWRVAVMKPPAGGRDWADVAADLTGEVSA